MMPTLEARPISEAPEDGTWFIGVWGDGVKRVRRATGDKHGWVCRHGHHHYPSHFLPWPELQSLAGERHECHIDSKPTKHKQEKRP